MLYAGWNCFQCVRLSTSSAPDLQSKQNLTCVNTNRASAPSMLYHPLNMYTIHIKACTHIMSFSSARLLIQKFEMTSLFQEMYIGDLVTLCYV
jgi:hypothetical protein